MTTKEYSIVNGEKIPSNVQDKALYAKIKKKIKTRVKKKGQRWGAYTSGNLVQAYKRAGGRYSGRKKSFIKKKRTYKAWSDKYKKSIDCKHPRGFSQRAHCAGRKKKRFNMKSSRKSGGLNRWFAEEWVDVCTGKPCGRKKGSKRRMPYCRPKKRITKRTPKTRRQLSKKKRREMCKKKRKTPKKRMKKV